MKTFKANLLTIAVLSAISLNVQADTDANTTAEKDVEVISVLGKRVSYANNTTDCRIIIKLVTKRRYRPQFIGLKNPQ